MKAGLFICILLTGASLGCFLKHQALLPMTTLNRNGASWPLGHTMCFPVPGPWHSLFHLLGHSYSHSPIAVTSPLRSQLTCHLL